LCFGKGQTWPLFKHKSILCFGQRAKLVLVTHVVPPKTQKNVVFGQTKPFLLLKVVWLLCQKQNCVFWESMELGLSQNIFKKIYWGEACIWICVWKFCLD
jgi:hypothetical protein